MFLFSCFFFLFFFCFVFCLFFFFFQAHSRYRLLCSFSVSLQRGTFSVNPESGSESLTVGCKTNQPSLVGFRIRSLAVWERVLSAKEVLSIYLAGAKCLSKC